MATYAGISALVPHIYNAVLDYAKEQLFMPSVVTVLTDQMGFNERRITEYSSAGTVHANVAEATDLPAQTFNPAAIGTLTPREVGYRIDLYDRRALTDAEYDIDTAADIARELAFKVMKQPEVDLMGHFSSFTGGTVWAGTTISTAGTLTWGNLMAARAIMEKNAIPGPYYAVVHPMHYHFLAREANIAGLANPAPLRLRDDIQQNYKVTQIGADMFLYTSPLLASAASQVIMGMFARPALALDVRKGLTIETQRDASARLTELVATLYYATGAIRRGWGVTIMGTVINSVNN